MVPHLMTEMHMDQVCATDNELLHAWVKKEKKIHVERSQHEEASKLAIRECCDGLDLPTVEKR